MPGRKLFYVDSANLVRWPQSGEGGRRAPLIAHIGNRMHCAAAARCPSPTDDAAEYGTQASRSITNIR